MAAVVFDVEEFRTLYPQFEKNTDEQLQLYFNVACMLCNNTDKSLVKDLDERKLLLYMLTCHITTLKNRGDMVGPLSSASEGGVSASFGSLNNQNWYNQTQCGAMYWLATAKYRVGMRYYVRCKCQNGWNSPCGT